MDNAELQRRKVEHAGMQEGAYPKDKKKSVAGQFAAFK